MIGSPDPAVVEQISRRSPLAAMTTVNRLGNPSVRLVHPIWDPDGRAGVMLTDGTSLKAVDVQERPVATLVYQQRDDKHLLTTVRASVIGARDFVAATVNRFEAESVPYGYRPRDFWSDEQFARIVAVRLDLIGFELTTFTNNKQEVIRWWKPKSSSASVISPD
ncbi:MAG: pyridoxamine 5'-phosphate oxidase family protein [Actinobacteria bacterium]|nr:pyridoxamine 5'-phosphate oxidase family protein [Actinomycetota bacterium]